MRIRTGMAVAACAAAVLLAGCSDPADTAVPVPTTTSAPPTTSAPTTGPTTSHSATPTAVPTTAAGLGPGDVDCGPITAGNGKQLTLVATATAAGTPGCTEAINVMTEYFQRAATESEGTLHMLTVQGWRCSTVDDPTTVITGCEQQGLSMQAH